MAKRKTTAVRSAEKRDTVKFCSFWGLVVAAALFVVTAVLNVLSNFISIGSLATVLSILDILAKAALLVAIALPAYGYVRGKGKKWKAVFWVALAVYALGVVFSVIKF